MDFNQIFLNDNNHQVLFVDGPKTVSYTHLTLPTILRV